MKNFILMGLLCLSMIPATSQTILFGNDFEAPAFADSLTSSEYPSGVHDWNLCSTLQSSGIYSDSCTVKSSHSPWLMTPSIKISGYAHVYLEFMHICKIHSQDSAVIEYSTDNGILWQKLGASEYEGSGSFTQDGNRFSSMTYANTWMPTVNVTKPDQSWWKKELFDLSTLVSSGNDILLRFRLGDGGTAGAQNNYGWIIDDIKVFGGAAEMIPPKFNSVASISGTVYYAGPYTTGAVITDQSGIDTVFIEYMVDGLTDTMGCISINPSLWLAELPKLNHLDTLCYRIIAVDASPMHNKSTSPSTGYYCLTPRTNDPAIEEIVSPYDGCDQGDEVVSLEIQNYGVDTVRGLLQAEYYIEGRQDTVREFVTDHIPSGESINFSFTQPFNIGNISQDTSLKIFARLTFPEDLNPANNQLSKSFMSGIRPLPPQVSDTTIPYSSSVLLTAVSAYPYIKWYADSLSSIPIDSGSAFQTPTLLNNTSYYVEASSDSTFCRSLRSRINVNLTNIPVVDLSVTRIKSPISGMFLGPNENISVEIQSFGSAPIDSIPLYFSMDDSLVETIVFTDTLNILEKATILFNEKLNLSQQKSYILKCWILAAGDQVSHNDTVVDTITNIAPTYCDSYADHPASGSDIGNVMISNLNNGDPSPGSSNPTAIQGYTDFKQSLAPVQLFIGNNYNMSITRIVKGIVANSKAATKVFIDYDQSGTFEPATETVFSGSINHYLYDVSGSVTIPLNAKPGRTLMRVVLKETNSPGNVYPCQVYDYGETEDYMASLYHHIPTDAGVTYILGYADTLIQGMMMNPEVEIRNFGTDTLTSIDLAYEFNGQAAIWEQWNGGLAPDSSTTYQFQTPFTADPFQNNICAYTNLFEDINTTNDYYCRQFQGKLLQNARLNAILEPNTGGCSLSNQEVLVEIQNVGHDTIKGGLTAHLSIPGMSVLLSESVPDTIAPGSISNYSFQQSFDFSSTIQDTIRNLTAWLELSGDVDNSNDTSRVSLLFNRRPLPLVQQNDTVNYGQAATLVAPSSDSVFWFTSYQLYNPLHIGDTFITPLLYQQTQYTVQARVSNQNASKQIGYGTATTNYVPCYGYYNYSWSSSLYKSQELGPAGYITSISYYVGNSANIFMYNQYIYLKHTTSNTIGTSYPNTSGMTKVFEGDIHWTGPGWFEIHFNQPFYYNGQDNLIIHYENRDGAWESGYPNFRYSNVPGSVVYRYQDNSFPNGAGNLSSTRPNLKAHFELNCSSDFISDTVFVLSIPTLDASLIDIENPLSGPYLSSSEPLEVKIKNYGTDTISGLSLHYILDGGPMKTAMIPDTIGPGDTLSFIANQGLDMLSSGVHHLKVWIYHPQDTIHSNDTLSIDVVNQLPGYCISKAVNENAYEDIGNVTLGGMSNGIATPIVSNPNAINGYTDFTGSLPAIDLYRDSTYPISVSAISASNIGSSVMVKVYLDLNRDGTFNPLNEIIHTGTVDGLIPTTSANITIPQNAQVGISVMRVVMDRNTAAPPCGLYDYGETEDYLVRILPSAQLASSACLVTDSLGNVTLSWDTLQSQGSSFNSYSIYRRSSPTGNYTLVDSSLNKYQTSYTDSSVFSNNFLEYKMVCSMNYHSIRFSTEAFTLKTFTMDAAYGNCTGDSVSIDLNLHNYPVNSINWDFGGANVLSGSGSGPYELIFTSSGQKVVTAQVNTSCGVSYVSEGFQINPLPQLSVAGQRYFCPGQAFSLTASGGASYIWNTGDTTATLSINNLSSPTLYWVTAYSAQGCHSSQAVFIRSISTYQNSTICLVTTNNLSQKNELYWSPTPGQDIKSYNIHYATPANPGQWNLLGNIDFDQAGYYEDILNQSANGQYLYSIQVVDSCDDVSMLSQEAGPLYLSGVKSGNNVNLNWENYIGNAPPGLIRIHRKIGTTGNFSIIDSVSSNDTSYTDLNIPSGACYYFLELDGFNCSFSGNSYNTTYSNIAIVNTIGLEESSDLIRVHFVNDRNQFGILISEGYDRLHSAKLNIHDGAGRKILEKEIGGRIPLFINLDHLSPGFYTYRLFMKGGQKSGKFVR